MQLKNFECQIANAQIGRYLAGDLLSEEAVGQLEDHIAKCPDCKQNLAERRAVLLAMLSPDGVDESSPEAKTPLPKFDLADFIKSKIRTKQPVTAAVHVETPKSSQFTKPALYSLALGAVLIGMSYASKNVTSVFGPKATETMQSAPKSNPIPTNDQPAFNPAPLGKALAATIVEQSEQPIPAPVAPSKGTNPKSEATVPDSKPRHNRTHVTPRPESNTIRVYAPENQQ